MAKRPASAGDPLWYKDAVIYELHVRAFKDSNGDGIGDFPGLIERLDYLQDLGITCLWLLSFFPSPLKDDGYDICDYMNVHSRYGTVDDFKAFLAAAHECDLQVMIELVVNHTSDQHPWFQAARQSPAAPERDFYVCSDTDQKYEGCKNIFTDTERSNWTWDPVANQFYWHPFFSHQPDLNYDWWRVRVPVAKIFQKDTLSSEDSERRLIQTIPAGCSWRKRTSGQPMYVLISPTATNSIWPFIFRSCRAFIWLSPGRPLARNRHHRSDSRYSLKRGPSDAHQSWHSPAPRATG